MAGANVQRATACQLRRHRRHVRESWAFEICNLLNPKNPSGFESHSLRHFPSLTFRQWRFEWSWAERRSVPPLRAPPPSFAPTFF